MPALRDRSRITRPAPGAASPARPVLLATLSVRIDPSAERMALSSALDAGVPLIIANLMRLPPFPATVMLARDYATLPHEEDRDAVRATADRAAGLGIRTELLRIHSPRPVAALLELAAERDPGLLVFGPDLALTRRRRFNAAARQVREQVHCLVWIAPDG